MKQPQLSVIIPVYKTLEDRLLRALNSASSLTIPHETVVVFDGEPGTSLLEMMDSYAAGDATVRWVTIAHAGLAGARNAGIREATGIWMTFLDADDEIKPVGMEELVAYGNKHGCQLVQGSYIKQMTDTTEQCSLMSSSGLFRADEVRSFCVLCFWLITAPALHGPRFSYAVFSSNIMSSSMRHCRLRIHLSCSTRS